LPSGRGFAIHVIEYPQFLKSLVPDSVTLKADTAQYAVRPPPRRTPDILTGSRVKAMIFPFKMKNRSSTPKGADILWPLYDVGVLGVALGFGAV
jgi:hypothetical protein